jgi:acyl-CoA thioester hydrolase
MPKIKLVEREDYEFQTSIKVRPQDVNYGGHVGNDNLVSLVGTARARLLHGLGLSELDLGDGETGVIITDLIVNYKAEAFLFDELIIETHFDEFAEKGFRMFHRVRKDSKLVALVEIGFAAYDYAAKKTSPLPASFLNRLTDPPVQ